MEAGAFAVVTMVETGLVARLCLARMYWTEIQWRHLYVFLEVVQECETVVKIVVSSTVLNVVGELEVQISKSARLKPKKRR